MENRQEHSPVPSPIRSPERSYRRIAFGLALLSLVVVVSHGPALLDGFFFDDHWHQQELARGGWDADTLLRATTIEPARFMHHWWQDHAVRWEYVRPAAVAFQKVVHDLTGGDPIAQHAASIALHWLCAMLVWRLCFVLTGGMRWSMAGALVFALYPHSVYSVGWLAAQNTLLQTAWMLAAVLIYIRASSLRHLLLTGKEPSHARAPDAIVPPLRIAWTAAVVVCWLFALLSRENAIILPLIFIALDLAFGGAKWLRRRAAFHVALILLMSAFAVWRVSVGGDPMPPVYCRMPDGLGYIFWCVAKLLHYLACTVFPTPMVIGPTGRYDPFREAPGDIAITAFIVAAAGVLYWHSARRVRGAWIWPVWILLGLLPVIPVLATSHSGYVCGVAVAVGLILGPARDERLGTVRRTLLGRLPARLVMVFVVASACGIKISRLQWNGVMQAERFTIAAIADDPAPQATTDVFFINLPFVNVYAALSLQEAWGDRQGALRCHALTYSPDLTRVAADCVVEQLDDHRFSVAIEGRPYFSGLLGRFLIEAMRGGELFDEGDQVDVDAFRVSIAETTAEGVSKLIFSFERPLSDPRYRFYVASRHRGATWIRFPAAPALTGSDAHASSSSFPSISMESAAVSVADVEASAAMLAKGDASAGMVLLATARHSDGPLGERAWRSFVNSARVPAESIAAPIRHRLTTERPDDDVIDSIAVWWIVYMDDRLLAEVARDREQLAAIAHERDELVRGRALIGRFVHADLFLTGEPFPGPR